MDALEVRAAAAHALIDAGLLDGELALSFVLFPSQAVKEASEARASRASGWTDAHRQEARRLQAEGLSWSQIAERVCGDARYKPTVGTWLRSRTVAH